MMRNSELAYMFARGETDGEVGNMFIRGDTIYSYGYHFPIAKRVIRNGATAYLFNSDIYSTSTTQQQSLVLNAISGEVIRCPDCSIENLKEHYSNEADELYGKLRRARSAFPRYINQLEGIKDSWEYAKQHYGLRDRALSMKLKFEKLDWLTSLLVKHKLLGRC